VGPKSTSANDILFLPNHPDKWARDVRNRDNLCLDRRLLELQKITLGVVDLRSENVKWYHFSGEASFHRRSSTTAAGGPKIWSWPNNSQISTGDGITPTTALGKLLHLKLRSPAPPHCHSRPASPTRTAAVWAGTLGSSSGYCSKEREWKRGKRERELVVVAFKRKAKQHKGQLPHHMHVWTLYCPLLQCSAVAAE
jgi:hypothetical protein